MKVSSAGAPDITTDEARLRGVVKQLEGVFVEQLFKAMRETVPDGGVVETSAGEDMFNGMFDQQLSQAAPDQWNSTLAEALFRQLRHALPPAPDTASAGVTQ
jgi:peptidoglycan hydrolase FlgJ